MPEPRSDANYYSLFNGAVHLAAGLATGLSGLAAGYAIGIVGDVCVRGYSFQPKLFVVRKIYVKLVPEIRIIDIYIILGHGSNSHFC